MANKKISSLKELKELAGAEDGVECFIALNGGMRSSKHIWYWKEENTFDVFNEIDDSDQEGLHSSALWSESNIGEALDKGALYVY